MKKATTVVSVKAVYFVACYVTEFENGGQEALPMIAIVDGWLAALSSKVSGACPTAPARLHADLPTYTHTHALSLCTSSNEQAAPLHPVLASLTGQAESRRALRSFRAGAHRIVSLVLPLSAARERLCSQPASSLFRHRVLRYTHPSPPSLPPTRGPSRPFPVPRSPFPIPRQSFYGSPHAPGEEESVTVLTSIATAWCASRSCPPVACCARTLLLPGITLAVLCSLPGGWLHPLVSRKMTAGLSPS